MTLNAIFKSYLLILLLCISSIGFSQNKKKLLRTDAFELSVGIGKKEYAASLGWYRLHHIGGQQARLKIGYSILLNHYRGKEKEFLPIPRDIRKDEALIDTLIIEKARPYSIGAGIHATYDIANRWTIGAHTELVSLATSKRSSAFLQSDSLVDGGLTTTAKAHRYGLFKAKTEDFGSLNTGIYVAYHFHCKWRVKLGLQKYWTEFRTAEAFTQENDRFFRNPWLINLGIVWTPFQPNLRCPSDKYKKQKIKQLKEGEL